MLDAIIYLVFVITGFVMGRMTKLAATGKGEPQEEKKSIPNPMKVYREHKEREKERKEMETFEIIAHNLEVYDGTGAGQKDVPKI